MFRRDRRATASAENAAAGSASGPRSLIVRWVVCFLLAMFVFNAGYLFRGTGTRLSDYPFESRTLRNIQSRFAWLGALPLPVPRDGLLGIDQQSLLMKSVHPVFLDGSWSERGFPRYYLMALLYKMPHPLQALLLVAAYLTVRPGVISRRGWALASILLVAVVLATLASISHMQLGVRYVLPVFPLLAVIAAQTARHVSEVHSRMRTLVVTLTALFIASVWHHPHHLAYFNEWAGGPIDGREHLVDSNIDWGQDLLRLRDYVEANRPGPIGLAYFGSVLPGSVGLKYRIPPSWRPEPGTYAVSVNFVMGRPTGLADENGAVRGAGVDEFGYFRAYEPVARIGHSIDLYRITPLDVLEWDAARRR
jgi:hypothetical protein